MSEAIEGALRGERPTRGESMTPTPRGRSHKGSWPSCSHPSGSGPRRSGHCAAAPIREARVDIIDINSRMPGDVIAHRKMTLRHTPAMSKACAADKPKRDQHDLCVGNRKAHPRRPCARVTAFMRVHAHKGCNTDIANRGEKTIGLKTWRATATQVGITP